MQQLIEKLENSKIGVISWVLTFFALIAVRMIFESLSGNGLSLYQVRDVFLEPPVLYGSTLFSMAILIHVLTKVEMKKVINLVLFGFPLALSGPVLDFVISGGSGDFQQRYLFAPLPTLIKDFFTFFGPELTQGATYGTRLQCLLGMIFAAMYVFIKTRKVWQGIVAALGVYIVAFFFGTLPALVGIFSHLPKNPWLVTQVEMLQKFIVPRSIFGISYGPDKTWELLNVEITLILLPIAFLQLLLIFYFWDRKKFLGFVKKLRYLRLFLQYIAIVVGVIIGLDIYSATLDLSLYGILAMVSVFITTTCVWIFSLTTNDLNDIAIDKISNQERLLVTREFEPHEFKSIGIIALVVALLASFTLGYNFMLLVIGNLALAYLYSFFPLRLRRFPLVAPLMMSLGISFLSLYGFLLISPSGNFVDLPVAAFMLIVFVVTLVINIKDIKDIEGDSRNEVYTIPTLFGDKRGKIIISILFLLSYLLFPIVFRSKGTIILSLVFAAFTWLLINSKKVHEGYVFGVYFLFLVVFSLAVS